MANELAEKKVSYEVVIKCQRDFGGIFVFRLTAQAHSLNYSFVEQHVL